MAGRANPKLAPLFMVPVEETHDMTEANTLERLMVDLINEERAAAGVAPLTIDDDLNTSSELHSQWMLENDVFDHTGEGGSTATERIRDAGYELEGSWATGENIGWQSERGDEGLEDDVRAIHESLMNSPEHRDNILSADYDEIGIGIEQGDFNAATGTFDAVMVTQNFGRTDADDTDDPAVDGETSATPELTVSEETPGDAPPEDDIVPTAVDDDDAGAVTDDPAGITPDGTPVVAAPDDDGISEDPVTETAPDTLPDTTSDDDTVAEDDESIITREFVVTNGSTRTTVAETITVDADGTTSRSRTETVDDTGGDAEPFSFDDLSDVFDFGSFDPNDSGADITVSDAAFSFSGPDGTVTTTDPAEFEALLADVFGETPETPTCPDALFA
jgi:uncharacterized protein YkwD